MTAAYNRYRHELTAREIEVITLLCAGLRGKQIAVRLNCSPRTVASHCYAIYRKTACQGAALGLWAARQGIVELEPKGAAE